MKTAPKRHNKKIQLGTGTMIRAHFSAERVKEIKRKAIGDPERKGNTVKLCSLEGKSYIRNIIFML